MSDNEEPETSHAGESSTDDGAHGRSSVIIKVTVKTPKDKETFDVAEDLDVQAFKELIAPKFNANIDQLCLIFAGKIMENSDTLLQHNVKDGLTVHLVIKSAPKPNESRRPTADVSATPFNLGAIGGLVGLQSLGMGSNTFMEIQNQMQNELLSNPQLLRQLLDNPLVQSLMNNPETMRNLITRNPQMQELVDRHPEIGQMLENTELLEQTMELARNPSMLQELMRNNENLRTEGEFTNPLQSVYQNFQQNLLRTDNQQRSTPSTNIFNNPSMTSLMQQMAENTEFVQSMLAAPYTQSVLEALATNPQMGNILLAQNPILSQNPELQSQIQAMMPHFVEQFRNPDIRNVMTNTEALDAIMQIQQGMETLRQTAPGLVTTFGLVPPNPVATESGGDGGGGEQPPSSDNFSVFMSRMVAGMAAQNDPNLPPENRYGTQLEALQAMGFTDREANLRALIECFGDLNGAVQRLISSSH